MALAAVLAIMPCRQSAHRGGVGGGSPIPLTMPPLFFLSYKFGCLAADVEVVPVAFEPRSTG